MVSFGSSYRNLPNVMLKKKKISLDKDEINLLKNGLDFPILPRFLKKTNVFFHFEMIA